MKIKTQIFLLLGIISTLSVYGQKNKAEPSIWNEKINVMKGKHALAVIVQPETNDNLIKHNEMLRSIVSSNWPYQKSIEYMTLDELITLKKRGVNDYAVLAIYYLDKSGGFTGSDAMTHPEYAQEYNYSYTYPETMPYLPDLACKNGEFEATLFLANLEDIDFKTVYKTETIFECNLYSMGLREYDLLSALNFITWYVDMASNTPSKKYSELYTENASQLKNKTLVIPKSYFIEEYQGKTLSEIIHPDEISNYYSFQFEVIEDDSFSEIILEKKPGYAYLILRIGPLYNDNTYISPVISDSETGDVILVSKPIDKKYNKQYPFMIKNHFESLTYYIEN